MALLRLELGVGKGSDDLAGQLGADDPGAQGEDVGMVVLDHLTGRVGVVTDRGPHQVVAVGGDHDPRTAATQQHTPLSTPGANGISNGAGHHRIVDRFTRTRTDHQGAVTGCGDRGSNRVAQRDPGVIGGDGNAERGHRSTSGDGRADAARSAGTRHDKPYALATH